MPEPKSEIKIDYTPWANTERQVGQAYVHASDAKFRTLMAGRQSGKTVVGIAEICWDAMETGGHVNWWITQNHKVAPRAWRGLLDFLPAEVIAKKNETDKHVVLINGSEIWVKSADAPDSLISESLDFAVCDEAGLWKEDVWYRGVSAMFAARPNARVLLIGTPRGKNWFHRTWLMGHRKDCGQCAIDRTKCVKHDPEYESFHWKSEDSPYVSKSFIAEQRRNNRLDTFLQEFEADPLDNALSAFHNIRSAVRTAQAAADQMTVVGVDLARKLDYSAMIAMNASRQVISVERFQDEWSEQKRRIVARSFGLNARCIVDATGIGDIIVEELRNSGVQVEGFIISNQSKHNLIQNLAIAFEQGTISIPNDQTLLDELDSYELEYDTETRRYKYTAPEGKHDDLVIALALALWGQRGAYAYAAMDKPLTYGGRRGETYGMRR